MRLQQGDKTRSPVARRLSSMDATLQNRLTLIKAMRDVSYDFAVNIVL